MSAAVRLIVFDAGGVFIRLAGSWEAARSRSGAPAAPAMATREFLAMALALEERHERGEIDVDRFVAEVSAATGASRGDVLRIFDNVILDEYPGWDAVLDRIEAAGIETALLSNSNEYHWQVISPRGARSGPYPGIARLGRHFGSHELRLAKPDPAIYRAVEDATGRHGPEILFFDDRASNVDAASAVGWRAHRIDPAGDPPGQVLAVLDELGIGSSVGDRG